MPADRSRSSASFNLRCCQILTRSVVAKVAVNGMCAARVAQSGGVARCAVTFGGPECDLRQCLSDKDHVLLVRTQNSGVLRTSCDCWRSLRNFLARGNAPLARVRGVTMCGGRGCSDGLWSLGVARWGMLLVGRALYRVGQTKDLGSWLLFVKGGALRNIGRWL